MRFLHVSACALKSGMDSAEVGGVGFEHTSQWSARELENKTVRITPEKGSDPRQLRISDKLVAMLNSLPKEQPEVFLGLSRVLTEASADKEEKSPTN